MTITTSFKVKQAFVNPLLNGMPNVIGKVIWSADITRNGVTSLAMGETLLDEPASDSFIEFDTLTEQQITDWVLAKEGGQAFIDMLVGIHAPNLDRLDRERGLQEAVLPFAAAASPLAAPARASGKAPAGVIPTVIL